MNMMKNLFYNILGLFLILCVVIVILTWVGINYVGIMDLYYKNSNTLFVTIPFCIFCNTFIVLCFSKK